MHERPIHRITTARPTLEGAGVRLNRVIGFSRPDDHDPFLLLDDFSSDRADDYQAGFPWHPHRGIETITYILEGKVEHQDSLGNRGVIGPGDVQWMTAGSGILHQEMPVPVGDGRLVGFQLWANLPARQKMMPPRYRDVSAGMIAVTTLPDGAVLRVISGTIDGATGPVEGIVIEPLYVDATLPAGVTTHLPVADEPTCFMYVFQGTVEFGEPAVRVESGGLAVFGDGDLITACARDHAARFLIIGGKPLHEPIAWRGPIVMNTEAEIERAYDEIRKGTFIKKTSL